MNRHYQTQYVSAQHSWCAGDRMEQIKWHHKTNTKPSFTFVSYSCTAERSATGLLISVPRHCCVLRWRHLVNAREAKAHPIRCWQNLGAICFWLRIPSGLNLVVAAVLRDSLWVMSLLLCVADCCIPCLRLSSLS